MKNKLKNLECLRFMIFYGMDEVLVGFKFWKVLRYY